MKKILIIIIVLLSSNVLAHMDHYKNTIKLKWIFLEMEN